METRRESVRRANQNQGELSSTNRDMTLTISSKDARKALVDEIQRHLGLSVSEAKSNQLVIGIARRLVYLCPSQKCDFWCVDAWTFKAHIVDIHTNDLIYPMYYCSACDYRTKWKCDIKSHVRREISKQGHKNPESIPIGEFQEVHLTKLDKYRIPKFIAYDVQKRVPMPEFGTRSELFEIIPEEMLTQHSLPPDLTPKPKITKPESAATKFFKVKEAVKRKPPPNFDYSPKEVAKGKKRRQSVLTEPERPMPVLSATPRALPAIDYLLCSPLPLTRQTAAERIYPSAARKKHLLPPVLQRNQTAEKKKDVDSDESTSSEDEPPPSTISFLNRNRKRPASLPVPTQLPPLTAATPKVESVPMEKECEEPAPKALRQDEERNDSNILMTGISATVEDCTLEETKEDLPGLEVNDEDVTMDTTNCDAEVIEIVTNTCPATPEIFEFPDDFDSTVTITLPFETDPPRPKGLEEATEILATDNTTCVDSGLGLMKMESKTEMETQNCSHPLLPQQVVTVSSSWLPSTNESIEPLEAEDIGDHNLPIGEADGLMWNHPLTFHDYSEIAFVPEDSKNGQVYGGTFSSSSTATDSEEEKEKQSRYGTREDESGNEFEEPVSYVQITDIDIELGVECETTAGIEPEQSDILDESGSSANEEVTQMEVPTDDVNTTLDLERDMMSEEDSDSDSEQSYRPETQPEEIQGRFDDGTQSHEIPEYKPDYKLEEHEVNIEYSISNGDNGEIILELERVTPPVPRPEENTTTPHNTPPPTMEASPLKMIKVERTDSPEVGDVIQSGSIINDLVPVKTEKATADLSVVITTLPESGCHSGSGCNQTKIKDEENSSRSGDTHNQTDSSEISDITSPTTVKEPVKKSKICSYKLDSESRLPVPMYPIRLDDPIVEQERQLYEFIDNIRKKMEKEERGEDDDESDDSIPEPNTFSSITPLETSSQEPDVSLSELLRCHKCPFHTRDEQVLKKHLTHHKLKVSRRDKTVRCTITPCTFVCGTKELVEHESWHFTDHKRDGVKFLMNKCDYDLGYEENGQWHTIFKGTAEDD